MVRPADGGGSGDSFEVTPERLISTAPSFHKASQDTADMLYSLNATAQQLIAEMFMLSELTRYANALETFYERWRISMLCLSTALGKVGINLQEAAGDYETADQWVSDLMKQTERNLPPIKTWGPGVLPPPNINPNPGTNPNPFPGVSPLPGVISYPDPDGFQPYEPAPSGTGISSLPGITSFPITSGTLPGEPTVGGPGFINRTNIP